MMESAMRYVLAPDGEFVKIDAAGVEYTGMFYLSE
jgi:hypothetical protein